LQHDSDDNTKKRKRMLHHHHCNPTTTAPQPYVQEVINPLIPRAELKDRINDAISEPLDLDRRLWEVRTATNGLIGQSGIISPSKLQKYYNNRRFMTSNLCYFSGHIIAHCMADGVSLGALFGDFMDEGLAFQSKVQEETQKYKSRRKKVPWYKKLLYFLYYWCSYGIIRVILYQIQLYWMSITSATKNPMLQPGDDIYESRSLSWLQVASVEEVKRVTEYYSTKAKRRVTINDISVPASVLRLSNCYNIIVPSIHG
jgi:hypothetical protein